jgi:Domain of unknown function (DUF4157)
MHDHDHDERRRLRHAAHDQASFDRARPAPGRSTLTSRLPPRPLAERPAVQARATTAPASDPAPWGPHRDPFGTSHLWAPASAEPDGVGGDVQRRAADGDRSAERAPVTIDAPEEVEESRATLDVEPELLTAHQLAAARRANPAWHRRLRYDPSAFGGDLASDDYAIAVAELQKAHRLTVDGIAGPHTIEAAGVGGGSARAAAASASRDHWSTGAPAAHDDAREAFASMDPLAAMVEPTDRSAERAPVTIDARPEWEESRATLRIQTRAAGPRVANDEETHDIAAQGVAGASGRLPHAETIIQRLGEAHRPAIEGIRAQVGGPASAASAAIGARAYATGDAVAFASPPDLHTAAHEATHVLQQRAGVSLSGGVGQAGDPYEKHADTVAERVVAGESAVDLLRTPAGPSGASVQRKEAEPESVPDGGLDQGTPEDSIRTITESFLWLNDEAQQQIEALRRKLHEEDEPPWEQRLLEAMLDVSLVAGAFAAGELLAGLLVEETHAVGREFVKTLFAEGIHTGVEAGRKKLGGHSDPIDAFIDSQKEAVRAAYIENQAHFIHVKRHQIHTLKEAKTLEHACSVENIQRAGVEQANATRDAWLSYLAQSKFGTNESPNAAGTFDEPTTTNMATQEQRDRTNKDAPGFVPGDAPSVGAAFMGDSPGVLAIGVNLPEIDPNANTMNGTPDVEIAILDGVNKEIRAAYEGRPIGELKTPRHIDARVAGDMSNFVVNLDEAGQQRPWLSSKEGAWLRARATVGHPENASKDDFEKQEEGLSLLLAELTVEKIRGRF